MSLLSRLRNFLIPLFHWLNFTTAGYVKRTWDFSLATRDCLKFT